MDNEKYTEIEPRSGREASDLSVLLADILPEMRARLAAFENTYPAPVILDARKKCEGIIERIEAIIGS